MSGYSYYPLFKKYFSCPQQGQNSNIIYQYYAFRGRIVNLCTSVVHEMCDGSFVHFVCLIAIGTNLCSQGRDVEKGNSWKCEPTGYNERTIDRMIRKAKDSGILKVPRYGFFSLWQKMSMSKPRRINILKIQSNTHILYKHFDIRLR
jgi:hypothetical protein